MREHTISFKNAWNGIKSALTTQANLKIHLIAALFAVTAGYYFSLTALEWTAIVIVITVVVFAEMANTALEHLSDAVTTEHNEHIKATKDVAAGAVLISAIASLVIAAIIFLPKI